MANNRSAIRSALKDILIAGDTIAEGDVYCMRKSPVGFEELPVVLIYTNQEQAVAEAIPQRRYVRTVELTIECKVANSDAVEDDIDLLVGQVENLIQANQSISGTVLTTILSNTEMRVDADGQSDIGVGVLTYHCQYIA